MKRFPLLINIAEHCTINKVENQKNKSSQFVESYGRLDKDDRSFDRKFWQNAGPQAIFEAAYDLIKDYFLLKEHNADEPQLQRTVESFQKKQL